MVRPIMTRAGEEPALHASAFAIQGGDPIDATDLVFVDTGARVTRRLFLCVEPLEPSARGLELAALARRTLREVFAAASDLPPAAALMKAFTAANAVLINENRPLAGCRWERRVYVGATGVVLAGHELIMAQVPPTAAMIVQDQQLYAFPELASWRDDYLFPTDDVEPEPLGCREGLRPYLYRSTAQPGDLLILCATALARQLGRGPDAATRPLLLGDPEEALDCLAHLTVAHALDDAHAAVVLMRQLQRDRRPLRLPRSSRSRAAAAWTPVSTPAASLAAVPSERAAIPPFAVRIDWGGVGVPLDRPLASEHRPSHPPASKLPQWLPRSLASAIRRPAPSSPAGGDLPPALPPLHAAFGARVMRRYREQPSLPLEWRANLPRGLGMRLPVRLVGLSLAALIAFGSSGALFDHYRTRTARADAALAAIDGSLRSIAADPSSAPAALAAAEEALAAARAAGADDAALQRHVALVEAARDLVPGTYRLRNVARLGALPVTLVGQPVTLARAGGDVWLISDALYSIDDTSGQLVEVLAPGDTVRGGDVGALASGAADDGMLTLLDPQAAFSRDVSGRWVRSYLAPESVPHAGTPLSTFQGSLYTLDPEQGLLKYAATDLTAAPTLWADVESFPDLLSGQDLAIDGQIHVLLQDGRVLTFLRHQLIEIRAPAVAPPVTAPSQLIGGTDLNALYIVEPAARVGPTSGRIIRLAADGSATQLLPPVPEPALAGADPAAALGSARDVAIDEANGLVYFVTDTDVWRAELPF